jgi:hypothetical protein
MTVNLTVIRRNLWIAVVGVGITFIGAGLFMVNEGMAAKDLVRDRLVAEQITTSEDAAVPSALVEDVATAEAQEALITEHTLGRYGPYSGMERGDPNRDTYLKGVTLRTALNVAGMGFKVGDLVIGIGPFICAVGLANVFLIAPLAYVIGRDEQKGGQVIELLTADAHQTPAAA